MKLWLVKEIVKKSKEKGVNALFVPIFWGHFYFGPYISILPLLIPKLINT